MTGFDSRADLERREIEKAREEFARAITTHERHLREAFADLRLAASQARTDFGVPSTESTCGPVISGPLAKYMSALGAACAAIGDAQDCLCELQPREQVAA